MPRWIPLLVGVLLGCDGGVGTRIRKIPDDAKAKGFVLLPRPLLLPEGQTSYDCGPESLGGVLQYWKKPADIATLSRALVSPELKSTATTKIPPLVRRLGLSATLYPGSMHRLKNAVDEGKPPIIAVRLGKELFHYYVVSGYNDADGVAVCEEVGGEKTLIPYETLDTIWKATGYFYLQIEPSTAASEFDQGAEYESAGNYERAEEHYKRALRSDPEFHEARLGLGNCLVARGNLGEARKEYERLLPHLPEDPKLLNNLAHVYTTLGVELERAERSSERSVDLYRRRRTRVQKRLQEAGAEWERGRLRRELKDLDLELAYASGTLGQIRFRRQKWAEAIGAWKAAVDLAPLDAFDFRAKRHYEIARAYRELRMDSLRRKHLGMAREIAKDPELKKAIEREIRR